MRFQGNGRSRDPGIAIMQVVTIKELSELLRVKEKTIYQWAESGKIPCLKFNGALRFDLHDIKKWMESCKRPSFQI